MGDLWIQVLPRTSEDRRLLVAAFGPKVMEEDAAGYEKLLELDPDNVRLHDAVAAIYLGLHRTDEAVAHLTEALRVNPEFELAHYNMAMALVGLNRLHDAADHFRRAAQIKPEFVAARVNLGAVLRMQHRYD